jgi:hypothetical protein
VILEVNSGMLYRKLVDLESRLKALESQVEVHRELIILQEAWRAAQKKATSRVLDATPCQKKFTETPDS